MIAFAMFDTLVHALTAAFNWLFTAFSAMAQAQAHNVFHAFSLVVPSVPWTTVSVVMDNINAFVPLYECFVFAQAYYAFWLVVLTVKMVRAWLPF